MGGFQGEVKQVICKLVATLETEYLTTTMEEKESVTKYVGCVTAMERRLKGGVNRSVKSMALALYSADFDSL